MLSEVIMFAITLIIYHNIMLRGRIPKLQSGIFFFILMNQEFNLHFINSNLRIHPLSKTYITHSAPFSRVTDRMPVAAPNFLTVLKGFVPLLTMQHRASKIQWVFFSWLFYKLGLLPDYTLVCF